MKELNDENLMSIVSNGNLEAMSIIFNRYKLKLYNFFYRMIQDRIVCEELTQNTFYKVMVYRHTYRGGKFESWLFKIARNNFYDYHQEHKKKQVFEPLELVLNNYNESNIDKEEEKMYLISVLNTLSEKDREIIIMNRIHKIKYQEIADIIDSNAVAVKARVHRIIKKIRVQYFKSI